MISIQSIIQLLEISGMETVSGEIKTMRQLTDNHFSANDLGWCSDKNLSLLQAVKAGFVILNAAKLQEAQQINSSLTYLPVDNPRASFSAVLNAFFVKPTSFGTIHSTAIIHDSVVINKQLVTIGANVVIEEGCLIGDHVVIGHNTIIKSDTHVSNHCKIGCNNTIGGVGFGYEMNDENQYELIPHIGNVVLDESVEIGNNVCIDRAVLGSTYLGPHVKVDNLVHIAHGVQIGKNSLIIANAMIAGSVEIGENTWVSPSVSIRQKLTIGDHALVGLGAVVVKSVENNSIVAGNPAKPLVNK